MSLCLHNSCINLNSTMIFNLKLNSLKWANNCHNFFLKLNSQKYLFTEHGEFCLRDLQPLQDRQEGRRRRLGWNYSRQSMAGCLGWLPCWVGWGLRGGKERMCDLWPSSDWATLSQGLRKVWKSEGQVKARKSWKQNMAELSISLSGLSVLQITNDKHNKFDKKTGMQRRVRT